MSTLKVTIIPSDMGWTGNYPTYLVDSEGGVGVGPAGELLLVANFAKDANKKQLGPLDFRIYAPGTWKEVNVTRYSVLRKRLKNEHDLSRPDSGTQSHDG